MPWDSKMPKPFVSFAQSVAAVLVAETRSTRRSIGVWLLLGLGLTVALTALGFFSYVHGVMSERLLSGGHTGPRFLFSYFADYFLWFVQIGVLFVAVDVCNQDRRDRIRDVVDSKPVTNFALFVGRTLGLVLTGWLPLTVAILGAQLIGLVARAANLPVGDAIEPMSLLIFVFVYSVPQLFLWCALLVCLATALGNRAIAALFGLGILGAQMWCHARAPAYLLPAALRSDGGFWASDIIPQTVEATTLIDVGSLLLLGVALLVFAGVMHRRRDVNLGSRLLVGIVIAVAGIGGVIWSVLLSSEDVRLRETWLAVHTAAKRVDGRIPDIDRVKGVVRVIPGEVLAIDLDLDLRPPLNQQLLFSLNPGMDVEQIRLEGKKVVYLHANGLLMIDVPKSIHPTSAVTISLRASGIPDARFAYLDSAVDWRLKPRTNRIGLLGTEAGIYDKRYVALLPGLCWLPKPGTNVDHVSSRDFFTADLAVEVPENWWVAGPSDRREDFEEHGTVWRRFRFFTSAVVPEIALIAAPFRRRATQVAGVKVELLVHPAHTGNVELLSEAAGSAIVNRVEELLNKAARMGLNYPYSGLTLVEAPSILQGYGGGSRMESVLASSPGVFLFKEHGLPNARLEGILGNNEDRSANDVVRYIESYFDYDYTDGRLLPGLAHNLVSNQMGVAGSGAVALDYLLRELAVKVLQETPIYRVTSFSAHAFDYDVSFGAAISQTFVGLHRRSLYPVLATSRPDLERSSVWQLALNTSLRDDLHFHDDPQQATYALMRRGGALARGIVDSMGRKRAADLLAELRERYVGRHIRFEEFVATAKDVGDDVGFVEAWINSAQAPGFQVSPATVVRVNDDIGSSTHHVRLHVRNTEPAPGLVRIGTSMFSLQGNDPVAIPGNTSVLIGTVLPDAPKQLYLLPYLSLNRNALKLELHTDVEARDGGVFQGTLPSAWRPPPEAGIVVDDLDLGFSLRHEVSARGSFRILRGLLRTRQKDHERELAEYATRQGDWARLEFPSAWGRHYRTVAWALPGNGGNRVVFDAQLSERGLWELEYYLPDRHVPGAFGAFFGGLGTFDMTLVKSDGDDVTIEFDGATARVGWNSLGRYLIGPGPTSLVVSNRTSGELTVADATRWLRVDSRDGASDEAEGEKMSGL